MSLSAPSSTQLNNTQSQALAQDADALGIGFASPSDPISSSTDPDKDKSPVAGSRAFLGVPAGVTSANNSKTANGTSGKDSAAPQVPQPLDGLAAMGANLQAPRMIPFAGAPSQPASAESQKGETTGGVKIGSGPSSSKKKELAEKLKDAFGIEIDPNDIPEGALKAKNLDEARQIIDGAKKQQQATPAPAAAPAATTPPAQPMPDPTADPFASLASANHTPSTADPNSPVTGGTGLSGNVGSYGVIN